MKRKWELSRNWAQMEAKTGTNDTTAPDDDNEDENDVISGRKRAKLEQTTDEPKSLNENDIIKTEPFSPELTRQFTMNNGDIHGPCYFCDQLKTKSIDEWRQHFQLHCGEDITTKSIEQNTGLDVFECKQCFCVQMTDADMVQHSLRKHASQSGPIATFHRFVNLLPDLNYFAENSSTKCKFISPAIRYQCGMPGCDQFTFSENNLKNHFEATHIGSSLPFICPHCAEPISSENTFEAIAQHLQLHGETLFECCCNAFESTDQNIIIHIWNEHQNDDFKFRRIERDQTGVKAIEDIFSVLHCNLCHERFRTVQEILLHFIGMHNSQNLEFTGTYWITRTGPDLKSISKSDDRWLARQLFICNECEIHQSVTKAQLYEHHENEHPLQIPIRVKYSNITWSAMPTFRHTAQCVYCDHITFPSIRHVYNHWRMVHLNHLPFRFSIAGLAVCGHCHLEGTYQALQIHFSEKHSGIDRTFVNLVNRKMCAFCDYTGEDMSEHFKSQHDRSIIENPFRLSSQAFQEALDADFFGVDHGLGPKNHIVYLICGCCQDTIKPDEYFEHFIKKIRPFVCLACSFQTNNLYAIANHEVVCHNAGVDVVPWITRWIQSWYCLSKVVFNNGLVISKYNLSNTVYDDRDTFEVIARSLMQQHAGNFVITDSHEDMN